MTSLTVALKSKVFNKPLKNTDGFFNIMFNEDIFKCREYRELSFAPSVKSHHLIFFLYRVLERLSSDKIKKA